MGWVRSVLVLSAVAVCVGACGGNPRPDPTGGASPLVTKLLVFVVENHSFDQMREGMPEAFDLARRYGYATSYRAVAHPSLPDYIAIAAGRRYDVTDDGPPSKHRLEGSSVFGRAIRAGKTARIYAESMSGDCAVTDTDSGYLARHNPWVYFINERRMCLGNDLPMSRLPRDLAAQRLPTVGMVVPNRCHDGHNCPLVKVDSWLRGQVDAIMQRPDWRSGHLCVVVTADEDDHSQGNKVLTIVLHPSLDHRVVGTPLTHYSLTRMYEDVAGLAHLANAATAPSMTSAFGLQVR